MDTDETQCGGAGGLKSRRQLITLDTILRDNTSCPSHFSFRPTSSLALRKIKSDPDERWHISVKCQDDPSCLARGGSLFNAAVLALRKVFNLRANGSR